MQDLNARSVQAVRMIEGTARSMGIEVEGRPPADESRFLAHGWASHSVSVSLSGVQTKG